MLFDHLPFPAPSREKPSRTHAVYPDASHHCGAALNVLLKKLPGKLLPAFCLLGITGYGLSNYISIWEGYRANYDTIVANDATLSAYKPGNMSVVLKKLPDERYANAMPYTPGTDYIEVFMKQYYDIPMEVPLVFKDER